ncbi:MAG: hypothetical protein ACE5JP_14125 [Candidatus Bipolaricaulia bacterium]
MITLLATQQVITTTELAWEEDRIKDKLPPEVYKDLVRVADRIEKQVLKPLLDSPVGDLQERFWHCVGDFHPLRFYLNIILLQYLGIDGLIALTSEVLEDIISQLESRKITLEQKAISAFLFSLEKGEKISRKILERMKEVLEEPQRFPSDLPPQQEKDLYDLVTHMTALELCWSTVLFALDRKDARPEIPITLAHWSKQHALEAEKNAQDFARFLQSHAKDKDTERRVTKQMPATPQPLFHLWADKAIQRRWINDLFVELSIQGEPIGAEALQERISQADLAPNELSRGIVDAREE